MLVYQRVKHGIWGSPMIFGQASKSHAICTQNVWPSFFSEENPLTRAKTAGEH